MLEKLFRGESKARKRAIYKSIGKINAILNLEQIEERVKKYVRKVEKEKKGSTEIGGGIRISGGISTSGAEAGVGGGLALSAEETKRQQETVELIYNGLAVIDYEAAKGELENIIEQCGAKGIILLVDEWSSVSMSLQPLLAEMIRKTIASSSKVFLKMGSLKYFTRTSAIIDGPQRIGFQSGIDITPVADLDQLLNFDIDRQRVKDFLTIVIYKHACQELPALKEYTVKQFEDYLCGELFQNQNAYFEVIRSSEGNPRDFLTILAGCCTGGRRHQKISQEDAIGAAVIHFTDAKAPEIKGNAEANELSNRIFQRVVKNKQKLFLCSVDKAESDHRIQELWHYRFFHIVNPIFTVIDDDGIPHDYIVYSMDYGKLLSLKVGEAGQKVLDLMQLVLDTTTRIGFRSGVSRILTTFLDSEELGGPLKKLAGKTAAQRKGVEPADISNPGFLVEKCVIDDLL